MGFLKNVFGGKGEEPRKEDARISCPYCKYSEAAEDVARKILNTEPIYFRNKAWMHRYHCARCRKAYWAVGSFDKVLYSKEIAERYRDR